MWLCASAAVCVLHMHETHRLEIRCDELETGKLLIPVHIYLVDRLVVGPILGAAVIRYDQI